MKDLEKTLDALSKSENNSALVLSMLENVKTVMKNLDDNVGPVWRAVHDAVSEAAKCQTGRLEAWGDLLASPEMLMSNVVKLLGSMAWYPYSVRLFPAVKGLNKTFVRVTFDSSYDCDAAATTLEDAGFLWSKSVSRMSRKYVLKVRG